MKRPAYVYALEVTDRDGAFIKSIYTNQMLHQPSGPSHHHWRRYHIYFTSDDTPEDGDYATDGCHLVRVIDRGDGILRIAALNNGISVGWSRDFKKIVASTDSRVWTGGFDGTRDYTVSHKIPDKFVKNYVELEGKIEKVLLEYDYLKHPEDPEYTEANCYGISVRPDGTVRVTPACVTDMTPKQVKNSILEIVKKVALEDGSRVPNRARGYTDMEFKIAERIMDFFGIKK